MPYAPATAGAFFFWYNTFMFSLFGGNVRKTKTVLIADIGSGSVGLALVELNRQGPPALLLTERVPVAPLKTRDAAELLMGMEKSLRDAGNRYRGDLTRLLTTTPEKGRSRLHPTQVAAFLRAPWCNVLLRNIRFARTAPFRVTPSLLEKMLSDYVRRERPDERGETVVERSAVGIRLNGYAVTDMPRSSEVVSAELTALSVTAPAIFLKNLRDDMDAVSGGMPVTAHSAGIAASFAAGSLVPDAPDYILCEVGGETTELVLVLEHIPSAQATFGLGSNIFSRTLEAHAGLKGAEIPSAMRLAKEKRSPVRERLSNTLGAAQKEYGKSFAGAFRELTAAGGSVPMVYILSEEPMGHWIEQAIVGSNAGAPAPQTRIVDAAMLGSYVSHAAEGPDMALALFALFADARFDEKRSFNFKLK